MKYVTIGRWHLIAALFVLTNGPYYGLPDVDPWDESRDARGYAGPHPVVAHPPCARWGRYWYGGPSCKVRKKKGDDGGCFKSALSSVRRYGGVLEHPESSHAWAAFGLRRPPRSGGWVVADEFGGVTCCVEQGWYGHKAPKATWVYAFGCRRLPEFAWGKSRATGKIDRGYHSSEERKKASKLGTVSMLSRWDRKATPLAFRDILIKMAQSV